MISEGSHGVMTLFKMKWLFSKHKKTHYSQTFE